MPMNERLWGKLQNIPLKYKAFTVRHIFCHIFMWVHFSQYCLPVSTICKIMYRTENIAIVNDS